MGSKRIRMLSGFNHNILYKGKTYHIQTEDGGRENPSIVTPAFLGGVILGTLRPEYRDPPPDPARRRRPGEPDHRAPRLPRRGEPGHRPPGVRRPPRADGLGGDPARPDEGAAPGRDPEALLRGLRTLIGRNGGT